MKRYLYILLAAVIPFSYSYSSNSKSRLYQMVKIEQENILKRFEQGKNLLGQKFTIQPGKSLSKTAESNPFPDSAIVKHEDGSFEKYFYTYNENEQLAMEHLELWENDSLVVKYRAAYTYDSKGNQTLYFEEEWDGTEWVNSFKREMEYDENGNMTSRLFSEWIDGNWEAYTWQTYEYSPDGLEEILLVQIWEDGSWVPSARYTDRYDENGNHIAAIIEFDNEGVLENWRKTEFTYDENGNRLTWSTFWWEDDAWEETYKYLYEYDSENRIISSNYFSDTDSDSLEAKEVTIYSYFPNELKEASITYDYVDGDLVPNSRSTTDLNTNGDRTYVLDETFNVDSLKWENSSQSTFTYNNDGKPTERIFQVWADEIWVNAQRALFEYDLAGNITYQSFQGWFEGKWVPFTTSITIEISDELTFWYRGGEVFLFYGDPVSVVNEVDQLPTKFGLEQNYPNPFNPSTTIQYSIPVVDALSGVEVQRVSLKIYDILGNEVTTLVNKNQSPGIYEVNFNAGGLSSGVYFYSIQAGKTVQTKKMMLLR